MKIREITRLNEANSLRPDPARVREIVLKQLPRYAKKAIPIAGWAYMLYDLYVRIVEEKDYKGAMMSVGVDTVAALAGLFASPMAGFAVQMAGITGLLARDTYGMMYCLDPKTKTPMFCPPGEARHGLSLQWEDDNYPGHEQRKEMWLDMIGAVLDDLKTSILGALPEKITGKQGADNARKAIRDFDTPNNPSPNLHPERYPK